MSSCAGSPQRGSVGVEVATAGNGPGCALRGWRRKWSGGAASGSGRSGGPGGCGAGWGQRSRARGGARRHGHVWRRMTRRIARSAVSVECVAHIGEAEKERCAVE